jgi:phosphatidylserine/phosphatidylglycerophosphate/cardiolipin synthase-like enzyme
MRKAFIYTIGILLICSSFAATAKDKIKVYFNNPVNTTVSTGVNAVYVNNALDDTLIAYMNRAKYTMDIAMYSYYQSSSISDIAGAINAAYNRGVKVRLIYDGATGLNSFSSLNSSINKLASPTGGNYNIMHNKFVLIDANSTNPNDAIVWTGSMNWDAGQIKSDVNNIVIVQDSAIAHLYTKEFEMMWGSTTLTPGPAANQKFGPNKTDLGVHNFTVDGHTIEVYFSPSDNTESHIQSTIATANKDLYFGVYTFTSAADANAIVARKNAGVYAAGIIDQYSVGFAADPILSTGLGTKYKVYNNSSTIYHSKMLIVDPSDKCSDPIVLTGSHNWTTTANTKNDENILIIHSDTIANQYYQSFYANFTALGGSLTAQTGCGVNAVATVENEEKSIQIFPNPATDVVHINYELTSAQPVTIRIYDMTGRLVSSLVNEANQPVGEYSYPCQLEHAGVYFASITIGNNTYNRKIAK